MSTTLKRTRFPRRQTLGMIVLALAGVLITSDVGWAAVIKINAVRDSDNTQSMETTADGSAAAIFGSPTHGTVATDNPCDDILMAIVIGADRYINIVKVDPTGAATADKLQMDPDQQSRLADAMMTTFGVGAGELAYVQLDIPDPCPDPSTITVVFEVFADADTMGTTPLQLPGDTFRAGLSDLKDLSADPPTGVQRFQSFVIDIEVACVTNLHCNDFNACTTDTCVQGFCMHAPTNAGGPCGSQIDDDCTDPDTCDADGHCLPNNAPDNTPCVNPDIGASVCTAGLCGAPSFQTAALPEDGHLGSEPTDVLTFEWGSGQTAAALAEPSGRKTSVRLIDSSGLDKAGIWNSTDGGETYDLQLLPTPVSDPSVANGIATTTCSGGLQTFVAVGGALTKQMPTAWSCDVTGCDTANPVMSPWVVETVPMPGGATTGIMMDGEYQFTSDETLAVGSFVDSNGVRNATVWTRSNTGTWSFALLPDNGMSAHSQALGIGSSGKDGIIIVGGGDDLGGNMMPAIWKETSPGSGMYSFLSATLPHHDGVATGKLILYDERDLLHYTAGDAALYDGTMRGILYRTADFSDWDSVVLSPLPGFANAEVVGFLGITEDTPPIVVVSGTSYNTDPLTDGIATNWRVISAPASLLYDRTIDVNQMIIVGSPGQSRIVSQLSGTTSGTTLPGGFIVGTIVFDGAATAGGTTAAVATPMPHAYGFTEQPAGTIPAVSTWGLAVLGLLILSAGTIAVRRIPRRAAARAGS